MAGEDPRRSIQKWLTRSARQSEVTIRSDDSCRKPDHDRALFVRSCGELTFFDVFTKSSTTQDLNKFPQFSGELFTNSCDLKSDEYFGGDIQATTLTFNIQGVSSKDAWRSRGQELADRYGSPSGTISTRVVVATSVTLIWNTGCFLLLLYLALAHKCCKDVGGNSEFDTASAPTSPWLMVFLAPLLLIGGILTIAVGLEWRKIYMHRRLTWGRSTSHVHVESHADVDARSVDVDVVDDVDVENQHPDAPNPSGSTNTES